MGNGAKILKNYEHSNYEVRMCTKLVRRERERVKDIFYEEREREKRREEEHTKTIVSERQELYTRGARVKVFATRALPSTFTTTFFTSYLFTL